MGRQLQAQADGFVPADIIVPCGRSNDRQTRSIAAPRDIDRRLSQTSSRRLDPPHRRAVFEVGRQWADGGRTVSRRFADGWLG